MAALERRRDVFQPRRNPWQPCPTSRPGGCRHSELKSRSLTKMLSTGSACLKPHAGPGRRRRKVGDSDQNQPRHVGQAPIRAHRRRQYFAPPPWLGTRDITGDGSQVHELVVAGPWPLRLRSRRARLSWGRVRRIRLGQWAMRGGRFLTAARPKGCSSLPHFQALRARSSWNARSSCWASRG